MRLADGTDPDTKALGYVGTFDPAADPLIGYWDFGANQSVSAEAFGLVVAATGLLRN